MNTFPAMPSGVPRKESLNEGFWPEQIEKSPLVLDFDSTVAIETEKLFWKSFSMQWLGFNPPKLYYASVKSFIGENM